MAALETSFLQHKMVDDTNFLQHNINKVDDMDIESEDFKHPRRKEHYLGSEGAERGSTLIGRAQKRKRRPKKCFSADCGRRMEREEGGRRRERTRRRRRRRRPYRSHQAL